MNATGRIATVGLMILSISLSGCVLDRGARGGPASGRDGRDRGSAPNRGQDRGPASGRGDRDGNGQACDDRDHRDDCRSPGH